MSSDSDDDFLCAPFRKNSRKSADSRQMFNFLDSICKDQDEHFGRCERIKLKQEADELEKAIIPPMNRGSTDIMDPSHSILPSTFTGDDVSIVSKSPDEIKHVSTTTTMKTNFKFDDDDPAYWSKIDEKANKAQENRMQREKRRREIHQAVHGYDSDDENASSSDRDEKRAIADATISGASLTLGTRHMIFSEARRGAHLTTFPALSENCSDAEALQSLRQILHDIDIDAPFSWPSDIQEVWEKSRKYFVQNYKESLDKHLLIYTLEAHSLTCKRSTPLFIHEKLISWLIETSCTCEHRSLQSSTFTAAISCLENDVKIVKSPTVSDQAWEMSQQDIGMPMFDLIDIGPFFHAAFGLWAANEPPPIYFVASRVAGFTVDDVNKISRLDSALKLWAVAFDKNLVVWNLNNIDEMNMSILDNNIMNILRPIAVFIDVIVRLGLDPYFYSGASLELSRMQLLQSFFSWLSKKLSSCNNAVVQRILQFSTEHGIKACTCLPDYVYIKEIEQGDEDRNGWLPISLTIRSFQFHDTDLILQFYGHFSIAAVRRCLDEISDWNTQTRQVACELMNTSTLESVEEVPLCFQCFASSFIALSMMDDHMPSIASNDPLYHCVIELAAHCTRIGMALLQRRFEAHTSGEKQVYENGEEATRFISYYETMEGLCDNQRKRITSVFSFPHFRRAKEYILILGSFYRALKENAMTAARKDGSLKKRKVQSELSHFISRKET